MKHNTPATLKKLSGKNHPAAKSANIYDAKTCELIVENVTIQVYARENGYDPSSLSATARSDRSEPSTRNNPHTHKGIYARYA